MSNYLQKADFHVKNVFEVLQYCSEKIIIFNNNRNCIPWFNINDIVSSPCTQLIGSIKLWNIAVNFTIYFWLFFVHPKPYYIVSWYIFGRWKRRDDKHGSQFIHHLFPAIFESEPQILINNFHLPTNLFQIILKFSIKTTLICFSLATFIIAVFWEFTGKFINLLSLHTVSGSSELNIRENEGNYTSAILIPKSAT